MDINPQPPSRVINGGALRLTMEDMPANFNVDQVDGTTLDVANIEGWTLPSLFDATPDGGLTVNHNYLVSAELTSSSPQVVTYTLNPQDRWNNAEPITWRDFASLWKSENGSNPTYLVSGTMGYSNIGSVTRGVNDQQVVVRFAQPYAEWQNLFSPLVPQSLTATPQAFNTAWKTTMPVSAGPFKATRIDPGSQTVVLSRDPSWWGTAAKLNQVIFTKYDTAAETDAISNNEVDEYDFPPNLVTLRRAQNVPGVTVRSAPSRTYTHLDFNGAPGALLSNVTLRRAIAQGVNRQEVADRMLNRIVTAPGADGNHFYLPGSTQYQDNSSVLPYDPVQARTTLDQLGWVQPKPGATRTKDGKPLTFRLVYNLADPTYLEIGRTIQDQMSAIGVNVVLQGLSFTDLDTALTTGNFELAVFSWAGTASPFSSCQAIYGSPVNGNIGENYGRIVNPQIDALFKQGFGELDPVKRAAIGNQIDRLVWQEAHSVIFYAWPGLSATRDTLANYGAFGLGQAQDSTVGFIQ